MKTLFLPLAKVIQCVLIVCAFLMEWGTKSLDLLQQYNIISFSHEGINIIPLVNIVWYLRAGILLSTLLSIYMLWAGFKEQDEGKYILPMFVIVGFVGFSGFLHCMAEPLSWFELTTMLFMLYLSAWVMISFGYIWIKQLFS